VHKPIRHGRALMHTLVVVTMAVLAGQADACIYLDEGFEGPTLFTNQNWPVLNYDSAPTTASVSLQGVNLRAWGPSAPSPAVQIGTQQGAVDTLRAFRGAKCYRLESGQRLATTPGGFPSRNLGAFRMWQFALSTDAASAALPAGTQAGHFKIDYSRNSASSLVPDLTITLSFLAKAGGKLEVRCQNNGAVVGEVQADQWAVVTVLAQDQVTTPGLQDMDQGWAAHDPLSDTYKGPRPTSLAQPDPVKVRTGLYVYLNSPSGAPLGNTVLRRATELGSTWQFVSLTELADTSEIGWEFGADNGGRIYLDELYWDAGVHGSVTRGFDQEQAARMTQFGPPRDLRLHGLFLNNMVLQRERNAPVWGGAEPGVPVTVSMAGQTKVTTTGGDGLWMTRLDPMDAGGPHQLVVSDGVTTLTRTNVMVGEVWVCSGQSNMVMSVQESDNAAAEIAAANWPRIRLFTLPFTPSGTKLWDVTGQWSVCSPSTVPAFSAAAYYFGRGLHQALPPGDVPIGLIVTAVGATRAEDWTSQETLAADPDTATRIGSVGAFGVVATTLYNGMINPLMPLEMRGVIWYQGESNADNPVLYRKLFPNMITSWRAGWGNTDPQFPFLFVQLPNLNTGSDWPGLREAQFMTLSLPQTAMAVTIDSGGTPTNLHPTLKQIVGARLARAARGMVYGEGIEWSGPLYTGQQIQAGTVRLSFSHAGAVLADRNGGALQGFTIAGADKAFVTANAAIDGATVVVSSPSVPSPMYVRYAWASNPPASDLANGSALLASPFRTDDFAPPVTRIEAGEWMRY
jgi:sialate O-acetylesterase